MTATIYKFTYEIEFRQGIGNNDFRYHTEEVVARTKSDARKIAEQILATFPADDCVYIREITEIG